MRIISAFRLVAYAPVYLTVAAHAELELTTLDGLTGPEGPQRLRAGDGDLLLGGPIRLLDDVRERQSSDLRIVASVTNACPFYVVSAPDDADDDGPVTGFGPSDAPARCLRAGLDIEVADALDGDLASLLATGPHRRILAPGDLVVPLERAGRARILISVPTVLPNIVFSAIEAVADHLPAPAEIALLRRRLDEQLHRCRFGPVGGLVEDLTPWFPELATDDLRALVARYRREDVWPRRSAPDESTLLNYARHLDPGLVEQPRRGAVRRLLA
jgi:hypothetical protein